MFEGDVKLEAVLGLTGGGEWHSRVVVQANGRDSRGMATDERIPLPAANCPKRHVTATLNFEQ